MSLPATQWPMRQVKEPLSIYSWLWHFTPKKKEIESNQTESPTECSVFLLFTLCPSIGPWICPQNVDCGIKLSTKVQWHPKTLSRKPREKTDLELRLDVSKRSAGTSKLPSLRRSVPMQLFTTLRSGLTWHKQKWRGNLFQHVKARMYLV